MRQPLILCIIFMVLSWSSSAQPSDLPEQSLDSILSWMESNYPVDSTDFHKVGLGAIARSAAIDNDTIKGDLYRMMASWHGYHNYFSDDSILFYDYKALEKYRTIRDTSAIINMYGSLSIDLINTGDYDEAQKVIFESIELCEKVGDIEGIAEAHRGLGALLMQLEKPKEAIEYSNKALAYYKSVDDYDLQSYTLLSLILSYKATKEYDKAYDAADECIRIVHELRPHQVYVLARAHAFKAEIFMEEEQYEEALEDGLKAWNIVKSEVGEERAHGWRSQVGDALLKMGRYKEALGHYVPSITHLEATGEDRIYSIYASAAECFEKIGDFENALKYEKGHSKIKNRMNEELISNLESEAIIKYETGKKDQAIALQQEQLQQKNRIQYLTFGILALVLGFLGSVLYYYRKNQKITEQLRLKNEENQTLVKEIHHRVKNNLQILSSLLSLQSFDEKDEQVIDALQEGRNRVESMGMIHQRLYSRDTLSAINMKEYIPDLCGYLKDSFINSDKQVDIISHSAVGLVDVETAIPLGLIINELITNALKYAFRQKDHGRIEVELYLNDQKQLCLKVTDDGDGGADLDSDPESTHFGTKLIAILSKKLKGEIATDTTEGYTTTIVFSKFQIVDQEQ